MYHFNKLMDWVVGKELKALSPKDCGFCKGFIAIIDIKKFKKNFEIINYRALLGIS